jgi:3-hydroxyacyl-CoA dehydrogenase
VTELERRLERTTPSVAVIGAGVVGRGWIPVFLRGGCTVRIYDRDQAQSAQAVAWTERFMQKYHASCPGLANLQLCATLEDAVQGAAYVQENLPEDLPAKQRVFRQVDSVAGQGTVLASSTSSLDIDDIAGGLAGAARCLTVHPFNPAAVLPAVEVLATRRGDESIVVWAIDFLCSLGCKPVRLQRFIPGYAGNRLQVALMREAINLVREKIVDADGVDTLLTDALALRWAALGSFGTNHTNADGGIGEYYDHYGKLIAGLMADLSTEFSGFESEDIDRFVRAMQRRFGCRSIEEVCDWRDDVVMKLRAARTAL